MSKVVLIEEEEALIDILENRLTKKSHEVKVVKNGSKAVEAVEFEQPALVLLDVLISGKDGFEILEEIRNKFEETPVIIILNSDKPEQLEKAQELGVKDWIIKTEFSPQQAFNKVEKQLNS